MAEILSAAPGPSRWSARARSVGQLGRPRRRRAGGELANGGVAIQAHEHRRAAGAADGLDPFGRGPQDQARDAEPGRLALDAAGIGEDGGGMQLQRQRRGVARGFDRR